MEVKPAVTAKAVAKEAKINVQKAKLSLEIVHFSSCSFAVAWV